MPSNPFAPFPTIETPRLRLRAITLNDTSSMFRQHTDPLVTKYLGRPRPTRAAISEKIAKILRLVRTGGGIWWVLADRETGAYLGGAGLWRWDKESSRSELGYDLVPARWGQGLMTEAVTPILRFGFERMKLHSVVAGVNPENLGSIRVLEKLGFQKEAHFRQNHFNGKSFEDTAMYGLLASD